jgi:hypothetical protein
MGLAGCAARLMAPTNLLPDVLGQRRGKGKWHQQSATFPGNLKVQK